jgi:tyrosyl-tRNA synthetase
LLEREEIEALLTEHNKKPHERLLQKRLAEEVTLMVHSRGELDAAIEASQILFGKGTTESLRKMSESTFLSVFEGVPSFDIKKEILSEGITFTSLCAEQSQVFTSKGELRRMVQGGGVSINKTKIDDPDQAVTADLLLNRKYLLIQKGKKNYYLLKFI